MHAPTTWADRSVGVTRAEAVRMFPPHAGVSVAMVSMWTLRGWLTPTGQRQRVRVVGTRRVNGREVRLLHRGDLLTAEAHTRACNKPHRPRSGLALGATA